MSLLDAQFALLLGTDPEVVLAAVVLLDPTGGAPRVLIQKLAPGAPALEAGALARDMAARPRGPASCTPSRPGAAWP